MKSSIIFPVLASMMLTPVLPAQGEGTHPTLTEVRAGVTRSGEAAGVDMTIQLDSLHLRSGRRLILRPIICSASDTLQLTPVVINGRKAHVMYRRNGEEQIDGAMVVKAKQQPREVAYSARVPYQDWMDKARVYVVQDQCGCGLTHNGSLQDAELLGTLNYPVNTDLTQLQYNYLTPDVEAVKERSETGCAYINFPVNQTVIYENYHENQRELGKIIASINTVKNDSHITIEQITIHGYASPEGSYANNTRLASGRAAAVAQYVADYERIPQEKFTVRFTPEDWGGLIDSIQARGFVQSAQMLKLINEEGDADQREYQLRTQFPEEYRTLLQEVYPRLRHSNYTIKFAVRAFTLEEAREYMQTHPDYLSLDEYFQVANSYAKGSAERVKALQQAAAQFPDDATAQLNAAIASLEADDLSTAARYAQQAGDSCAAHNVRGVIALRQGNLDAARQEFAQAASQGDTDAAHNLKMVEAISDTQSQQVLDD
jgi:outer membrane protein OmpA-like peptidoglycan-associated protein